MSETINRKNFKPNKTKYNNTTYESYEDFKIAVYSKTLYDFLVTQISALKNVLNDLDSTSPDYDDLRNKLKTIFRNIQNQLMTTLHEKIRITRESAESSSETDKAGTSRKNSKSNGDKYLSSLIGEFNESLDCLEKSEYSKMPNALIELSKLCAVKRIGLIHKSFLELPTDRTNKTLGVLDKLHELGTHLNRLAARSVEWAVEDNTPSNVTEEACTLYQKLDDENASKIGQEKKQSSKATCGPNNNQNDCEETKVGASDPR